MMTHMLDRLLASTLMVFLLLASPVGSEAQSLLEMDARGAELTRPELTLLLQRLEEAAGAPGYSGALREQASREASFVRERLSKGDFRVGDRVVLEVRGEPQLSDTFTVTSNRALDLPQIGVVSLDGVLRSELQAHLLAALSQFLREPEIRSAALIRVAVLGAVRNPGFYTLPATVLFEEALMSAGGPGPGADVARVSVQRGSDILWAGERLQQAMAEGRTLDQLSLQAGDRILVPQQRPGFFESGVVRTLLVTVPPLVFLLVRSLGGS